MPLEHRDLAYVWDIVSAGTDIAEFISNLSFHEFERERMIRYAVERQLLVIGEAARHLSEDFKIEFKEIPWKSLVGLRNVLAHEYGEILTERIWYVAKERLPELIERLAPLIADKK